jgi:hypothetical protein
LPDASDVIKEQPGGLYGTLEEMRSAFKIVVGKAEISAHHSEVVERNNKWKT